MYFLLMTDTQREYVEIKCQASLAVRDFEKEDRFFIPQPPHSLGLVILSQATHGVTCSDFDPAQRNLLHNLSMEAKIPFGTQERLAQ